MIPAKPDHSLFSSSSIKEKKSFVTYCSGRNIQFSGRAAKNPPPPTELDAFWDLWEENPEKSLPEPVSPLGVRIVKTCFQHLRSLAVSTASVFSKSLDPTNLKNDTFPPSFHQKSYSQEAIHQNHGQLLGAETLGEDSPNRIAVAEERDPSHTLTPHIRGAKALNVLDVIRHFDSQTQPIQPYEISTLVLQTTQKFPRHTPQEVLEALGRMTQFSQLSDLNSVVGFLHHHQESTGKGLRCDDLPTSLSSVIGYLREKGNYTNLSLITRCLDRSSHYDKEGYFLLDIPLLEALKEDPKAVEATLEDGIQFLIPEGYSTGIGPLAQTTVPQIEKKLQQLLTLADDLQEKNMALSWPEAISQALNKPLIDGLKALHPEFANRVKILQNPDVLSSKAGPQPKISTPFDIAQRLKPQRLSPFKLQQILRTISDDPIYQQAALELMIRRGEIYSPRRVGMALEAMHQNIQEYAHQEKIAPRNIFYLLPRRGKSFTIIAHQYQGIHQIPSKQFLVADETVGSSQALEELMAKDPHLPKLFVVLDDLAGSGLSYKVYMNREGKTLLEGHPNHTLYLSPVVSTQKALSNCFSPPQPEWGRAGEDSNGKVIFAPNTVMDSFKDTTYYQSLTPEEQSIFQALIQDEGFEKAMTQIVFPWMGTDTNNRFWAKFMVNPHTLNGKGNRPQTQANQWKRIEEEGLTPPCL